MDTPHPMTFVLCVDAWEKFCREEDRLAQSRRERVINQVEVDGGLRGGLSRLFRALRHAVVPRRAVEQPPVSPAE
jgi:hypothetical protein